MTPKRGQPPKPPEEHRTKQKTLMYNAAELAKLEEAYRLSESPRTFSRWLANITLEEAERIIATKK